MNEQVYRNFKCFLLLVIITILVILGWAGHAVLRQAQATLKAGENTALEVKELATDSREALSGAMAEIDATLQRVSVAADQVAEASKEQRKQALETTKQVTLFTQKANVTIDLINSQTIPALNSQIKANGDATAKLATDASAVLNDINNRVAPILDNTTLISMRAADATGKLDSALVDFQSTMKHVDGTMVNVEKTSQHIEVATRPAKTIVKALSFVWDKLVSLWTALK